MDAFDLRQWEGFSLAGGSLEEPQIIDQIVIDSRRIDSQHSLFVALKGDRVDGHSYVEQASESGAKFALVSLSWSPSGTIQGLTLLRVSSPLQAFQSIAKAYRQHLSVQIIGITGSFGKTMAKDFIYTLLRTEKKVAASPESFNSQIGVPLSLLTLNSQHEIAIIEAAISHKEEMGVLADIIRPNYSLLTPIGKKHLATLQDIPTLVSENLKFLESTPQKGWILFPEDVHLNERLFHFTSPYFCWNKPYPELPHATMALNKPFSYYQITFPDGVIYQDTIRAGHAYFLNLVNMATKVAWLMGISTSQILSVLNTYQPEPMRTEIWKSSTGATFINDTYCSDPQSVDYALRHFDYASPESRKIFVFGGMRSQSSSPQTEYRRIGKAIAQSHLKHLFLVGEKPFKPLIEEMQRHSNETEILVFEKYEETFSYLQKHIQDQDLIIFKGENKISFDKLTETFNDSVPNNQCNINLAAIQENLQLIRKKIPAGIRIMVLVKALAYGTDDVRIAKFLVHCGIDILGVSYIDEGVVLKRAGVKQAIFSIHVAPHEVSKIVKWDIEASVSDSTLIEALAAEAILKNKKVKVHLHVDTGMGRFGCRPEDTYQLAKQIHSSSSLELEGLMTHFACAENPSEDEFTKKQIGLFDHIIQELKEKGIEAKWNHAANSSGALRFHLPQYNMVRLGLAVYGLYGSEEVKKALDLRLALSLISRIVSINICKYGETVSYGRNYKVESEMQKIAVLPLGYFDGIHRHYSGKAFVLIRGQKVPMVGNICMDYLMIDVTNVPNVSVGDKVLIFGEDDYGYYLSPEELAVSGDSIVHELITCLGPRIQRVFVYEEGKQIR